jgi:hypothetical protein
MRVACGAKRNFSGGHTRWAGYIASSGTPACVPRENLTIWSPAKSSGFDNPHPCCPRWMSMKGNIITLESFTAPNWPTAAGCDAGCTYTAPHSRNTGGSFRGSGRKTLHELPEGHVFIAWSEQSRPCFCFFLAVPSANSIVGALGLKLEARKGPFDDRNRLRQQSTDGKLTRRTFPDLDVQAFNLLI